MSASTASKLRFDDSHALCGCSSLDYRWSSFGVSWSLVCSWWQLRDMPSLLLFDLRKCKYRLLWYYERLHYGADFLRWVSTVAEYHRNELILNIMIHDPHVLHFMCSGHSTIWFYVDCYVWVIITTARLGVRLIHGGVAGHSSIMHTHHCNTDHPFSLLRIHLAVNLDKK